MRSFKSFLFREYGKALRPCDPESFEECVKSLTVLCHVDRICGSSDDVDVVLRKRLRELDGGLSAERNDNAYGLFLIDDVQNVFRRKRLEIESVARVEISRNGLGVVVDDDYPIAKFAERMYAVNSSVVELDSLADPDRA